MESSEFFQQDVAGPTLVALVVCGDADRAASAHLRAADALAALLPAPAVPTLVAAVSALPRLASGKVDRKAVRTLLKKRGDLGISIGDQGGKWALGAFLIQILLALSIGKRWVLVSLEGMSLIRSFSPADLLRVCWPLG